jgi:hypothetical protein
VLVATSPSAARRVLASLALPGDVRLGQAGEPVRRLPSGIAALDDLLGGGLPRGRLSEIYGPVSGGKTALLLAFLAAATGRGEVTALVDLPDALHPATAHTSGVELTRLLWVRPPSLKEGLRCAELILAAGGFGLVAVDLGAPLPRQLRAAVWPRLARTAERAGAVLAIVANRRVAGSFATMSLDVTARQRQWSRGAWPLFDGLQLQLSVTRNKLGAPGPRIALQAERGTQKAESRPASEFPPYRDRGGQCPPYSSSGFRLSTFDF